MNPEMQQLATDILQSPKTALTVSTGTAGAGLGITYEVIQSGLGFAATLFGFALTCVLIYTTLRKDHREKAKHAAEMAIINSRVDGN